ncbi:hypothetical protein [Porphyrobacter sp. TH134]|uniref:hypothetical protein n=1 Tax=Porphyrobacter sp. TH134 TaxID=2067450 RepID=UPI0015578538|nr:hypothetical protein [Porphyrobacter sp. TH134]
MWRPIPIVKRTIVWPDDHQVGQLGVFALARALPLRFQDFGFAKIMIVVWRNPSLANTE